MGMYRLQKEERLSGKKRIEKLFEEGEGFFLPPYRVVMLEEQERTERPVVRVAVTVPRRVFKRAVKRNLLKRRIKEAYRRNKSLLTDALAGKGTYLDVMFIYTLPEILSYREIEEKLVLSLRKILKEYEKGSD